MTRGERKLAKRMSEAERAKLDSSVIVETEGTRHFRYGPEGVVDLDLYRRFQTAANKLKIVSHWVPEAHIRILAEHLRAQGASVARGLCHGTRRGNEQLWFRQHLGAGADVIGTAISDTATQFPHTIQWDFHEVDPGWIGAMDLIYSNSWDHSHDPEKAFGGWISCLAPGGFLLLDHNWNHEPGRVDAMDPFGITEAGLVKMLDRIGAGVGRVVEVIGGGKHGRFPIRTVIFRRDGP